MKALLIAILLVSGAAHAMDFTKGGVRNVTTAADGVDLIGQEALILMNSLNVSAVHSKDGFITKTLSLNGSMPATSSLITCSVNDSQDMRSQLLSAECYIGSVKSK